MRVDAVAQKLKDGKYAIDMYRPRIAMAQASNSTTGKMPNSLSNLAVISVTRHHLSNEECATGTAVSAGAARCSVSKEVARARSVAEAHVVERERCLDMPEIK